ncbi:putative PRC domain-containing protein [Nitrospira tepida]|uniref:PRC domain-containing protein n=1 Tax=Nitrospira tepida TaxID=2973512 RepID=A0AA86T621_9BACT|nr:PRC-barrel domain-containing protein [Nitrospira tepida]CAI4032790.1 putative PRC domain-containing protein [Nitrospira tepida]
MKTVLSTFMFASGLALTTAAFADATGSGQGHTPAPGKDQTNITDSLEKGDIPEKYNILPLLHGQPQSVDGHQLEDAKVLDKNGKPVGKLEDVIVDSASGKIAYAVVLLDENQRRMPVAWSNFNVNKGEKEVRLKTSASALQPTGEQAMRDKDGPDMDRIMKEVEKKRQEFKGTKGSSAPAPNVDMTEPPAPVPGPPGPAPSFEGGK